MKKVGFLLIVFVWVYVMLWGILSLIDWIVDLSNDFYISVIWSKLFEWICGKKDKIYYVVVMVVVFFLFLLIVIVIYFCVFCVVFI